MKTAECASPETREGYRPEPNRAKHPVFQWPLKPSAILKYLFGFPGYFLPYPLLFGCISFLHWQYLTPPLEAMKSVSIEWIALLFARNLSILMLFAGLLHIRLYARKSQGTQYKYDSNWLATDHPTFIFRNQLRDNLFWNICSAVPIWTAYEACTFWLQANDIAPIVSWQSHPVYCTALLVLIPIWMDIHFFTTHRLLHWRPLFKAVHSIHHKNVNIGPWSGLAMHPVEHLVFFSEVVLFWIIPSHPLHSIYILQYLALGAVMGHHGFDRIVLRSDLSLRTNHYMHYLHHRYFKVNFGNGLLPLDRWFGSFHDGSDEATRELKSRSRARLLRRGM